MMNVRYPIQFDGSGHTAQCTDEQHVRDLIEQVLLTSPGERVNRPTFGSGMLKMVFAPNSDAVAAAAQLAIQGALQQWLADLIQVENVSVRAEDAALRVTVQYVLRRTQERRVAEISRGGPP
jgi:hypothetical protein